ncbi:hypothetical protein Z043_121710, partial [Scleropages formosus]
MASSQQHQQGTSLPRPTDHGIDSDMDIYGYRRGSSGHQEAVEVLTEEVEADSSEYLGPEEEEWGDTVQLYREKKALLRYFVFEGLRYMWMKKRAAFCQVSVLTEDWTCSELYGQKRGLSHKQQIDRRKVHGPNLIDVPVKSYLRLLLEEVLNPLYIFQAASIVLWIFEKYYYYAACIFIISLLSIAITVYEIRKQSSMLRRMAQLVVNVRVRTATGGKGQSRGERWDKTGAKVNLVKPGSGTEDVEPGDQERRGLRGPGK